MRQVIKEGKRESKDGAGRGVWIEEEWEMDEEREELKSDRGRKWEEGERLMMEKKAKRKRKEERRDRNRRNRKGNGDEEEGG